MCIFSQKHWVKVLIESAEFNESGFDCGYEDVAEYVF